MSRQPAQESPRAPPSHYRRQVTSVLKGEGVPLASRGVNDLRVTPSQLVATRVFCLLCQFVALSVSVLSVPVAPSSGYTCLSVRAVLCCVGVRAPLAPSVFTPHTGSDARFDDT